MFHCFYLVDGAMSRSLPQSGNGDLPPDPEEDCWCSHCSLNSFNS